MGFPASTYPKYGGGGKFPGARVVLPTTDSGYKLYGPNGRLFLPAGENVVSIHLTGVDTYTVDPVITSSPPAPLPAGFSDCLHLQHTTTYENYYPLGGLETPVIEVVAGEVWTVSAYVHVEAIASESLSLAFQSTAFGWWDTNIAVQAVTTGFTRISYTKTIPVGTTWIQPVLATYSGTGDFYVTGFQVEKSPILTPYFEGTREASSLLYPLSGALQDDGSGTVAARLVPMFASDDQPRDSQPITFNNVDSTSRRYFMHAGTTWAGAEWAGGDFPASGVATNTAANVPVSLITRHAGELIEARANGVDASTAPREVLSGFTQIKLGAPVFNQNIEQYVYIGPVAIAPYRITDAETAVLDAMLTANCSGSDLYKWFQRKSYGGTMVLPLEGDSRAYIVPGG